MKPMSLLPLTILLVTSGCPFGPEPGPPPPDDCSNPSALDGIDTIEVGALQDDEFVPWQDAQPVELTFGSQGGAMLGVALSLSGSDLPGCMPHTMELTGPDGRVLAVTDYPVRTYPGSDGTRVTATIWMIFLDLEPLPGEQIELELHVGSREIRRLVYRDGPRPERVRILDNETLHAGGEYSLMISFDRPLDSSTTVTIESSDPDVVRPLSSELLVGWNADNLAFADIEAVAPGGPVTLSVTGGGKTVELDVTVLEPPAP